MTQGGIGLKMTAVGKVTTIKRNNTVLNTVANNIAFMASLEHTCPERWAALSTTPGERFGVRCLALGHFSHVLWAKGI